MREGRGRVKGEQDLYVSPSFQGDHFQKKNYWRNSIDSQKYVPCGTLNSLTLFHHSADYIFWSFGTIELMLVCFEYTILLKPELGGVREIAHFSISHEQTQ